ncbi:MAG: adenine deaminase C-terminal domain-containing protein [Thermodesulfobacteriota bacterium]
MRQEKNRGTEALGRARKLMDTALGRLSADLVVTDARIFNVFTGELLEGLGIGVKAGKIVYVGENADKMQDEDTRVIDADGMTVIPGLIDGHTHIDNTFLPQEFLRYSIGSGTTTVVTEVFAPYFTAGLDGVLEYLTAIRDQPIKIFAAAPAMVSVSDLSAGIDAQDLESILAQPEVICMGESYWQGVLQNPDRYLPAFEATLAAGKPLEGHTAGAGERKLAAYLASGVSSCHEPITAQEALSRLRQGLCVMIREGEVRRDLEAISEISKMGVDLRRASLVSDGVTPEMLMHEGYMDAIVQKAINLGFDPVDAVRMASLNVAEHFGLDGQIGAVAPGRDADFLLIPDLGHIRPECVVSRGRVIAQDGKPLLAPRQHDFPEASRNAVYLPRPLQADDFAVTVQQDLHSARIRAIEMSTDLVTRERIVELPVNQGVIQADPGNDLVKVAAVNYRQAPGRSFTGFILGFGIRRGAIAASGAWDSSDIVTVGASETDMAVAVNRIGEMGGGIVAVKESRVIAEMPMPILGVISGMSMEEIVENNLELDSAVRNLGTGLPNPVLSLLTLTGAAIPFVRICEQGLVDLKSGESLELFA